MSEQPYRPTLPPKAGYVEVNGRYVNVETGEVLRNPDEYTVDDIKQTKLAENSQLCNRIIENEFKSTIKGDGLKPYRMNAHDQLNLSGMQGLITLGLMQDPTGNSLPYFSWQNGNQIKCVDDWHYWQILGLIQQFGGWKTLILKRQDKIKADLYDCETEQDFETVAMSYDDLLVFYGGGNE